MREDYTRFLVNLRKIREILRNTPPNASFHNLKALALYHKMAPFAQTKSPPQKCLAKLENLSLMHLGHLKADKHRLCVVF